MKQFEIIVQRTIFYGAFVVAAVAVLEKIFNFFDYTFLKGYYTPWRLLELSAVGLLFVIVLQLRQIRISASK